MSLTLAGGVLAEDIAIGLRKLAVEQEVRLRDAKSYMLKDEPSKRSEYEGYIFASEDIIFKYNATANKVEEIAHANDDINWSDVDNELNNLKKYFSEKEDVKVSLDTGRIGQGKKYEYGYASSQIRYLISSLDEYKKKHNRPLDY
jgi:hypothetical protein